MKKCAHCANSTVTATKSATREYTHRNSSGDNFIRILTFAVLLLLTGYFQLRYDRYELYGPDLVDAPFRSVPAQNTGMSAKTIRLSNQDPALSTTLTQSIVPGPGVTNIRAVIDARANGVTAGALPWNTARVVLASIPSGDAHPDYSRPHELVGLIGTTDWKTYSRTFHIYPHIGELRLQAQLMQATGVLEFKQLSLHAAKLKGEWPWLQGLMIGSLLIYIGVVFAPYLRGQRRRLLPLLMLAAVASILLFTAMPAGTKTAIYQLFTPLLSQVPHLIQTSTIVGTSPLVVGGESSEFFRIMHYLCFAGATVCLLMVPHSNPVRSRLMDLLTLAVTTECLQVFVRDRGPSGWDVGVDALGILTGWLLWRIGLHLYQRGSRARTAQRSPGTGSYSPDN